MEARTLSLARMKASRRCTRHDATTPPHMHKCKSTKVIMTSHAPFQVPFDICSVYFYRGLGTIMAKVNCISTDGEHNTRTHYSHLLLFASFSTLSGSTAIELGRPTNYASRTAGPSRSWALLQAAHRPRSVHPCRRGHSGIRPHPRQASWSWPARWRRRCRAPTPAQG